jgi:hypothetical protein
VHSISPTSGVGLSRFRRSRKMMPGSPFLPGLVHDLIEHLSGVEFADDLSGC